MAQKNLTKQYSFGNACSHLQFISNNSAFLIIPWYIKSIAFGKLHQYTPPSSTDVNIKT